MRLIAIVLLLAASGGSFADEPKDLLRRGQANMEKREFAEAIADFTKAIELDSRFAAAFDAPGIAYFKTGEIKKSLNDFDKFIALVPKAAAAHWRRGLTLYYADEFAKGVAQFTTSDKEEPNDVENAVWHFLCNARVKGVDRARGYCEAHPEVGAVLLPQGVDARPVVLGLGPAEITLQVL